MLVFIQTQPDVVERLLRHIETPAFADLLVRIIQLDELPVGAGVLEVCASLFAVCSTANSSYPRHAVAVKGAPHVAPDRPPFTRL